MLGSTLLSAATALFFLPAVFSAPISTPDTSVQVPDVPTTTITTTKGQLIQKFTEVFVQKNAELNAVYEQFVTVDTSTLNEEMVNGIGYHVSDILASTLTGLQDAVADCHDVAAVEVDVGGLVQAISDLLTTVLLILGHVLEVVDIIKISVVPVVLSILATVLNIVQFVVDNLVPLILTLVGEVLVKVTGLVGILVQLVAVDLKYVGDIVALLGISL